MSVLFLLHTVTFENLKLSFSHIQANMKPEFSEIIFSDLDLTYSVDER